MSDAICQSGSSALERSLAVSEFGRDAILIAAAMVLRPGIYSS